MAIAAAFLLLAFCGFGRRLFVWLRFRLLFPGRRHWLLPLLLLLSLGSGGG
jgi:hypothetical protein